MAVADAADADDADDAWVEVLVEDVVLDEVLATHSQISLQSAAATGLDRALDRSIPSAVTCFY